jgi:hypothetical protein
MLKVNWMRSEGGTFDLVQSTLRGIENKDRGNKDLMFSDPALKSGLRTIPSS